MIDYSPAFREHISECQQCAEAILANNFDLCLVGEQIYRDWLLEQIKPAEMSVTE